MILDPTERPILHTQAGRRGQVADMMPLVKWGAHDARRRAAIETVHWFGLKLGSLNNGK